jgi:SMC interacting uncharacterized protein involved in chromosome segregation
VDGLKAELQRVLGNTSELSKNASAAEGQLRAELERAQGELKEAVTEGNAKYNAMIAERMQAEDELRMELERVRGEAGTREAELVADVEAQKRAVRAEKEHWEGRFKQADSSWCVLCLSPSPPFEGTREPARIRSGQTAGSGFVRFEVLESMRGNAKCRGGAYFYRW